MAENQAEEVKEVHVIGFCEIIEKLGQGGMGAVFKARQISLDRIVALKVLPPKIAKDAQFIERFQREARACAKLNHPNIVQGINVGQDAKTGLWYFVMEYVDGPTLKGVLDKQKIIPEKRALEIIRDVAKALDCARTHGLVHRDVKPDNIILTSTGQAKLADLGLAKQVGEDSGVTQTGTSVGTPYYMAPEQARGALDEIDFRTDEYALGATLYHLVTGQLPFDASTGAAVMVKHLTEKAPLAHKVSPNVSEACGRLIERMMQKEREKRFQSPAELLVNIDKVMNADPADLAGRLTTGKRSPVTVRAAQKNKPEPKGISKVQLLSGAAMIPVVGVLLWTIFKSPVNVVEAKPTPPSAVAPAVVKIPETEKAKTAPTVAPVAVAPITKLPVLTPSIEVPVKPAIPELKKPVVVAEIPAKTVAPDTEPKTPDSETQTKHPDVTAPGKVAPNTDELAGKAAHGRFLGELIRRAGKNNEDLPKVLAALSDLSLKPEYAAGREAIRQELKDLENVVALEEKAVNAIAGEKGDIDLPDDFVKLAGGMKTGKILRAGPNGRSIAVSVSGVELTIPVTKLPLKKLLLAAPKTETFNMALLAIDRGALEEARALISAVPESDRPRLENKLELLKSTEAEFAAEAAHKELLELIRTKQWKQFNGKFAVFQKLYGDSAVAAQKMVELNAFKEAADLATTPPVVRLFHAKSAKLLADGFLELVYDFKTPEQLQDFACDHGALTLEDGYIRVPLHGGELAAAKFVAPIAELRHLEVTGKTLRRSERLGVYFLPQGADAGFSAPRCMCRGYNRMPHLEYFEGPYTPCNACDKCNITGPSRVNWLEDLTFVADGHGRDLSWKVGGNAVGDVKLPAAAMGGTLAFVSNEGDHAWRELTLIFQPDAAWVKAQNASK